jgi:hypothetical protein
MRPVAHILLVNVDPILYSTLIQPVRRNQLQIPAILIPGEIDTGIRSHQQDDG